MKPWRLTLQAEERIQDIARWTTARFGHRQAIVYRDKLIDRLNRLAQGEPPHARSCEILMKGRSSAEGLKYYRQGQHYIIMRETAERIDVLDFLHVNVDLPAHVERLAGR
ncbi:MAG: type II toxin-antitoxin system RelE/ParE family toxin [Rhizobiales bacterium]|nr:type II toxin-antitoxin system RelE/ParE family toxin [Hyphomicrobiales bacterium]